MNRSSRRFLRPVLAFAASVAALDLRGTPDDRGQTLEMTEVAVIDEIAAAADLVKGKTLVVVDTKTALDRVARVLASVDVMPAQVLIEAKFIEVRSDFLRDIGVEFGSGANGAGSAAAVASSKRSPAATASTATESTTSPRPGIANAKRRRYAVSNADASASTPAPSSSNGSSIAVSVPA